MLNNDVVTAVAMRAVLRIVGTCILCVRDMYASLDHHMICCTQGERKCVVTDTFKTMSGQAFRVAWCMCVGKAKCWLRPKIYRRLWRASPARLVLSHSYQDVEHVFVQQYNRALTLSAKVLV